MPKVQLIRRDGKIIELEATSVFFDVLRGVKVWPIPIAGVRAAFDLNENRFSIGIKGILTDDDSASGQQVQPLSLIYHDPQGFTTRGSNSNRHRAIARWRTSSAHYTVRNSCSNRQVKCRLIWVRTSLYGFIRQVFRQPQSLQKASFLSTFRHQSLTRRT